MSIVAIPAVQDDPRRHGDVLADYDAFVDAIALNPAQRSQRRRAARRFLERHGDPQHWLDERPTVARLLDLHRLKAWPWLTWLIIDRRVRVDLELLVAKPGGVDLGVWPTNLRLPRRPRQQPGSDGARTGPARCCATPPRCCACGSTSRCRR